MLTEGDADDIINKYRDGGIGNKEYGEIVSLFVKGIPGDVPSHKVVRMARMLLSSGTKQVYLNELKNYLFSNDKELYHEYAGAFRDNPGCFEAFGIRGDKRSVGSVNEGPKAFESLRPQLCVPRSKNKSNATKRTMNRENKKLAHRKIVQEKRNAAEYNKKMSAVLRKIQKN